MYIQIAILLVSLVSLFFLILLFSQNFNNSKKEELIDFKSNLKEYIEIMTSSLKEKFNDLTNITKERLEIMTQTMDQKLEKWFEKTNSTFSKIIERMAKIDQAQKNIEKLSNNVVSLQETLTDSKQKGIFGEVQLEHIVSNLFGKWNQQYYEMEYFFAKQKVRVDCVIKTPQWLICIDAKFPLKHRYNLNNGDINQQKLAKKDFFNAVKKQIDEISSKYNIPDQTLWNSFMFIPSESIFASINTWFYDLIDYAQNKKVSIVSPTTLTAMLTIVLSTIQSQKTQEQALIIQSELWKLSLEFKRFYERRGKFSKDIKTVHKDIDNIDITSSKIIWKFDKIENLEFENE